MLDRRADLRPRRAKPRIGAEFPRDASRRGGLSPRGLLRIEFGLAACDLNDRIANVDPRTFLGSPIFASRSLRSGHTSRESAQPPVDVGRGILAVRGRSRRTCRRPFDFANGALFDVGQLLGDGPQRRALLGAIRLTLLDPTRDRFEGLRRALFALGRAGFEFRDRGFQELLLASSFLHGRFRFGPRVRCVVAGVRAIRCHGAVAGGKPRKPIRDRVELVVVSFILRSFQEVLRASGFLAGSLPLGARGAFVLAGIPSDRSRMAGKPGQPVANRVELLVLIQVIHRNALVGGLLRDYLVQPVAQTHARATRGFLRDFSRFSPDSPDAPSRGSVHFINRRRRCLDRRAFGSSGRHRRCFDADGEQTIKVAPKWVNSPPFRPELFTKVVARIGCKSMKTPLTKRHAPKQVRRRLQTQGFPGGMGHDSNSDFR